MSVDARWAVEMQCTVELVAGGASNGLSSGISHQKDCATAILLVPFPSASTAGPYDDACFFLLSCVLSRFRTVSSVWLLSRIFMYAASVSWMVASNSLRACILRARSSFNRLSRSVSLVSSFCTLAFSSSSRRMLRFSSSRFSLKSSMPAQRKRHEHGVSH